MTFARKRRDVELAALIRQPLRLLRRDDVDSLAQLLILLFHLFVARKRYFERLLLFLRDLFVGVIDDHLLLVDRLAVLQGVLMDRKVQRLANFVHICKIFYLLLFQFIEEIVCFLLLQILHRLVDECRRIKLFLRLLHDLFIVDFGGAHLQFQS